mgnify:CR=1 FL=1
MYKYIPTIWEDEIIDVDESGQPIPKVDENGNIIRDIFGNIEWVTIQDGTRIKAKRLNNMEDGIVNAHKGMERVDNAIKRLQLQLEMTDRVPSSSGAFFDDFSGEPNTRFVKDNTRTDLTEAVNAGGTVLKVASATGFKELTEITIFDGTNMEHVQIASINTTENTLTLLTALTNAYVKGAKVCRSATAESDGEMQFGSFNLFSIEKVVE